MPDQPLPPPDDSQGQPTQPPAPLPPEGQPSTASANAAARLLGGRPPTKVKNSTTERFKEGALQVRQTMSDKEKATWVFAILVILVIAALIGMIIMRRPAVTTAASTVYTPEFNVALSSQEELHAFTSKYGAQMTAVQRDLAELIQTTKALSQRQTDNESLTRDVLKQTSDEIEKKYAEKFKRLEDFAKVVAAPQKDPRTKAILDQFRENLANLKESPAEAKAHAAQLLKQAGYTDEQIRNALAEAAQQAGRISVGDIAEPPVSPQEIAALPAWVQPLVGQVHQRLETIGVTEGRVFPQQVTGDVKDILRAKAHDHIAEMTDATILALTNAARVRRENITQDQEDLIPFLVTVRDQARVAHDDLPGIAGVIWRAHERFPDSTTPGQILSLCQVVARAVGATSADAGAFRQIDEAAVVSATEFVTTAVVNAIALGKLQGDQYEVGTRALSNYLDSARMSATDEQRRLIILRAMAAAAAKRQPIVDKAAEGKPGAQVAKAAEVREQIDTNLYFGPLHVDRLRVQRALVFAIPALMSANGLETRGAKGAAALVTAVEQVPRLVGEALPEFLGKPLGGKDFFQVVLPEVLYAIRMGDSLGNVPLPVSPGRAHETGREAELVRGATIGAIYGPLVHDEAKAKAAAQEAMGPLEANPPLTPVIAEGLAKIPEDRPVQAIVGAYDAVRPGRFGYPAERYQDLVGVMARELAAAREIRERVAALFLPNQQGLFDENVRVLIPLSMAVHDDLQVPVKDVATLVHKDLLDYTALFLSEGRVSQQTLEVLIPKYAAAMSEEAGGGSALVGAAMAVVPAVVSDLMTSKSPRVQVDAIGDVVAGLTDEALPIVEARLVQEVVLGRVLPRLKRSAALSDKDALTKAMQFVFKRVREVVAPAYTPVRIDTWSTQLTEEARQILLGGAPAPTVGGTASGPGGQRKSLWPIPSMVPATTGGQLVGTSVSSVRTRQVLIPANTYGNAHVQTGVDAEIGGRSNVPVLLQMDFDWVGPANSHIIMRGCRLSGTANAMAGPRRVAIDLKQLSYVFPDGREIREDIKGFVSDNISGEYGALGDFHWNIDRIALPAIISGGAKGFGEALKNNGTTQVVGAVGTATTVSSEGKTFQQAVGAGVGEGFGVISDFAQGVIKDVHASVSMVNGQSVSVVLLDPVLIHVPEDEFATLSGGTGNGFGP